MLDNEPNQPIKSRTKKSVEINDDANRTYNTNSQSKFKNSMLNSSLFDYGDGYILVTVTVPKTKEIANPSNRKNIIIINLCPIYWLHKWTK